MESMETTIGGSGGPLRENMVKVSPRGVFPAVACLKVNFISPYMAILLSITRSQKSAQIYFKLDPGGSSKRIDSWIQCILWLKNLFC